MLFSFGYLSGSFFFMEGSFFHAGCDLLCFAIISLCDFPAFEFGSPRVFALFCFPRFFITKNVSGVVEVCRFFQCFFFSGLGMGLPTFFKDG